MYLTVGAALALLGCQLSYTVCAILLLSKDHSVPAPHWSSSLGERIWTHTRCYLRPVWNDCHAFHFFFFFFFSVIDTWQVSFRCTT